MNNLPGATPIKLTFYDGNDEEKQTFTRTRVPWGVLKKAIRLNKSIEDPENITEEQIDAMAELVVEVFGQQFTVADVDKYCAISEMLAVMQSIVTGAAQLVQSNPTPPSATLPRVHQKRK
jgi:hypothetical protein